jgi:hypothetical protein
MRVQKECSTTPARHRFPSDRDSAFTAAILSAHRTRIREVRDECGGATPDTRDLRARALFAGPWDVESVEPDDRSEGTLHAVVRRAEPMAEGGGAVAVLRSRTTALLTAAALSVLANPNTLHVNPDRPSGPRRRHGHTLHDGRTFLGHLTPKLCPDEADEAPDLLAPLRTSRARWC